MACGVRYAGASPPRKGVMLMMRYTVPACVLLAVGCAPPPAASAPASAPASVVAGQLFAFHADFWVNLHEALLHESALAKPGWESPSSLAHQSVAPIADLLPGEVGTWQDAVG